MTDDLRFDGRVALVTGGGRGLGRAYAELLGRQGARVVVNDFGGSLRGEGADAGPAQEVADAIHAAGGEAIANADTVATAQGGRAMVAAALDGFGRIDILIHNAGIAREAPLEEMADELYESVLDVHLRGGFHVLKPAFAAMKAARYGRIVLTSSIGGLYGNHGQAAYASAKAGLFGLGNVAALEGEAHGIRCNTIVPGAVTRMAEGIDTSAYPAMTAEMVAPAVAWLAHEDCSINGELIASIAGRVARMRLVEARGVFREDWTIRGIGEAIGAIRDMTDPYWSDGHVDHIVYSCAMAKAGG